MDMDFVVFGLLIPLAFCVLLFWLLFRIARALEKIANNLWAISRTNTRSAEALEKVADRIERIADNENIRQ